MRNDELDPDNPYRFVPSEEASPRGLDQRYVDHDHIAFDDSDGRWRWVRTGLLLLMFGYFCVPLFVAGIFSAGKLADEALLKGVLIVGTTATLVPISLGWLLCALTPPEVGTARQALLAATGTLLQVWIALGRALPAVVFVPQPLITSRTLISVITLGLMLRYMQGTFEYLKPGHSDSWVLRLRQVTNWVVLVVLATLGVIFFVPVNLRQAVLAPLLALIGVGAVAIYILFWGSLFRLWFLLRGEGQAVLNESRF